MLLSCLFGVLALQALQVINSVKTDPCGNIRRVNVEIPTLSVSDMRRLKATDCVSVTRRVLLARLVQQPQKNVQQQQQLQRVPFVSGKQLPEHTHHNACRCAKHMQQAQGLLSCRDLGGSRGPLCTLNQLHVEQLFGRQVFECSRHVIC